MDKGEIWIVNLSSKDGKEQSGARPCLILADTKANLVTVIPLTSNLEALRFPYTVEIKSSDKNGLENDSIALLFQLQAIDKRRMIKKIGSLEKYYVEEINKRLRSMLQL